MSEAAARSGIAPSRRADARPHAKVGAAARALVVAVPLCAVLLSVPSYSILGAWPVVRAAWPAVLAAAVLYALSHALRAARLALLAAPALGMHVRTILLLHFHAAPISFIVPFKLGELYRWQQLAWLSRNPVGSLLILLLDRALDAVILLVVLAGVVLVEGSLPPHTGIIAALLATATVLALLAVLIVPGCLEAVQAYILQNHSAPRARRVLRIVDSMRLMINSARDRLHGNVVLLVFISAAIWALESGMLVLLARQLAGSRVVLTSLMTMTLFPQITAGPTAEITSLYVLVGLATLLVLWPPATILYLMRIRSPLRTLPSLGHALSARRTRRLHLRATAKTL